MFKKILLVAAFMLPFIGASAQTTLKIGIVNQSEIVPAMPEYTQAQTQMQDIAKNYETEYTKLGQEMQTKYEDLQKNADKDLPAIRERKAKELEDLQRRIQTFEQNAQQDMQKQQQTLLSPILQKVQQAIESVAKEGNFSLVQDYNPQTTFYYAAPVVDITPMVKQKLGLK